MKTLPEGVVFPHGTFGMNPAIVRGPCAIGLDVKPTKFTTCIFEMVGIRRLGGDADDFIKYVPRLVFYGDLPDDVSVEFVARQYRVRAGAGDADPDFTTILRLQQRLRRAGVRFWRRRYLTAPSPVKISENIDEGILKAARTMVLDDVHWAAFTATGMLLPQNFRDICGGQFVREMTNSTRVEVEWHGQRATRWVKSGDDDAFHSVSDAFIAIEYENLARFGSADSAGAILGLVSSGEGRRSLVNPNLAGNLDDEDEDMEGAELVFEA